MPLALPTRWYTSIVAALAVFFVGLTIWRVPVVGYLVISEVEFSGSPPALLTAGESPPSPGVSLAEENTRQQIADAIREANRQLATEREEEVQQGVTDEQIRWVRQRLDVKTGGGSGPETRMQILFEGTDPDWSLVLVDSLVRGMLVTRATASDSRTAAARKVRKAKWQVEQLRHYERKARFDLEDALNAHFEQLAEGAGRTVDRSTLAMNREVSSVVSSTSGQPFNPAWERLQDEFAQLTTELQGLLKTVTANHPRVRDVTLQMDEIRRQLESTSKFADDASSHSQASAADELRRGSGATGGGWPQFENGQVASAVATQAAPEMAQGTDCGADVVGYQHLRGRYDEAIQDREEAERELSVTLALQQSAVSDLSAPVGHIIRPATLLQRIGGRPSSRCVLLIGLTALLCGSGIGWGGGVLRGARFVHTVSDLQGILAIPVVSQISLDPATAQVRRLLVWGRVVRWSTRVCELVLGVMVLLFLLQALSGSPAAKELADNPLGTFVNLVADSVLAWF